MRARTTFSMRAGAHWLMAMAVLFVVPGSWAQGETATMSEPPAPPAADIEAPEAPSRVRILRDENGVLTIKTRGEDGERSEVQVDLGEEFGGPLSQRIIEKLESKGILDERGQVVEEALDSVPENVEIGLSRRYDHSGSQWFRDHEVERLNELLIPVVALLCVFGMPVLIVWLVTHNSYRKKQLLMDNINRMVAEGRDVPPELFDALEGNGPSSSKDRGFTLIAVGAAVFLWLTALAGIEVGSLGLIPLFIGLARFINWKLDKKQA